MMLAASVDLLMAAPFLEPCEDGLFVQKDLILEFLGVRFGFLHRSLDLSWNSQCLFEFSIAGHKMISKFA